MERLVFGRMELRPAERLLLADGLPVSVGTRAFDVLVALAARRERVVDKEELFQIVWPGMVVEDNNLTVQISSLRKLLDAGTITTVTGRGYQFTARAQEPLLDRQPGLVEDAPELADFMAIASGQHQHGRPPGRLPPGSHDLAAGSPPSSLPAAGRGPASAAACRSVNARQPPSASASNWSSRSRSKGSPSAVPCTSMKRPSPVITTFISVSALTSSS